MIKTFISATLFMIAGVIILGIVLFWSLCVIDNFKSRSEDMLNWSPFNTATLIGVGNFMTTPVVWLTGTFGLALILLSVAFQLREVRNRELAEQQLPPFEEMEQDSQHKSGPYP